MDKQREAFEAWKKINNALGYGLSRAAQQSGAGH